MRFLILFALVAASCAETLNRPIKNEITSLVRNVHQEFQKPQESLYPRTQQQWYPTSQQQWYRQPEEQQRYYPQSQQQQWYYPESQRQWYQQWEPTREQPKQHWYPQSEQQWVPSRQEAEQHWYPQSEQQWVPRRQEAEQHWYPQSEQQWVPRKQEAEQHWYPQSEQQWVPRRQEAEQHWYPQSEQQWVPRRQEAEQHWYPQSEQQWVPRRQEAEQQWIPRRQEANQWIPKRQEAQDTQREWAPKTDLDWEPRAEHQYLRPVSQEIPVEKMPFEHLERELPVHSYERDMPYHYGQYPEQVQYVLRQFYQQGVFRVIEHIRNQLTEHQEVALRTLIDEIGYHHVELLFNFFIGHDTFVLTREQFDDLVHAIKLHGYHHVHDLLDQFTDEHFYWYHPIERVRETIHFEDFSNLHKVLEQLRDLCHDAREVSEKIFKEQRTYNQYEKTDRPVSTYWRSLQWQERPLTQQWGQWLNREVRPIEVQEEYRREYPQVGLVH